MKERRGMKHYETDGRCLWCGIKLTQIPMPQCPVPEVHDHAE